MVKLRIDEKIYYKHKLEFMRLYKKHKLKWIANDLVNDGWYNLDSSSYLLKLDAPVGIKRFDVINCVFMEDFLTSIGAVYEDSIKPCDGVIVKPFYKEAKEFSFFIGADLYSHKRTEELLAEMPDNWGVKWK